MALDNLYLSLIYIQLLDNDIANKLFNCNRKPDWFIFFAFVDGVFKYLKNIRRLILSVSLVMSSGNYQENREGKLYYIYNIFLLNYLCLLAFKGFGIAQVIWTNKKRTPLDLHFFGYTYSACFTELLKYWINWTSSGSWHFQQTPSLCMPKCIMAHTGLLPANPLRTWLSSLCLARTSCNPLQRLLFPATHLLSLKGWFPRDPFLQFFVFFFLL